MKLYVTTRETNYPIHIERNAIQHMNDYVDTNRNVFILSDKGVPSSYLETIKQQCHQAFIYLVPQGEGSKSFATYQEVIQTMMNQHMGRHDVLIAVGGGVIGDLGGFVSATYMRGIDFVNVPTTTLAQIDSSIGGKVAINVGQTKNIVGAFYPPTCVIIDPLTLQTLPRRHFNNGLIEAIKAGMLRNITLFERFETNNIEAQIEDILYEALLIKKEIVEADEFEQGERKLLNLGHTLGHAIESQYNLHDIHHGEGVALGMLPMVEDEAIVQRLLQIYRKLNIPMHHPIDVTALTPFVFHDKKKQGKDLDIILLKTIGQPYIKRIDMEDIYPYLTSLQTILQRLQ